MLPSVPTNTPHDPPPQVNTPRMLQEILPALMAEVIDALADASAWPWAWVSKGIANQWRCAHCEGFACLQPSPASHPRAPPAGEDRRTAAARCLGELVRKMGERVLHRMLPILRESMGSDSAAKRQVRYSCATERPHSAMARD